MAPAPAASPPARRKGLDLGNPGAKEYVIVGGSALGLALLYFWWKNRQAGTTAAGTAAAPAGTTTSTTPTGLSTAELWSWISDHHSSKTTKTTRKAGGGHGHDGHREHKVKVPDVTGDKYMAGAKEIRGRHLIAQRGTPFVGTVRRESPHAGTSVRPGTVVTLSGKSGGGGTWPGHGGRHHKKRHKHKKHHPAGK